MITGIRKIFKENKVEGIVQGFGPMFQVYFTKLKSINDSREFVTSVDQATYSRFGRELLQRGVFISPIASENWFISTAHSNADVDFGLKAVNASVKALKNAGTLPTK